MIRLLTVAREVAAGAKTLINLLDFALYFTIENLATQSGVLIFQPSSLEDQSATALVVQGANHVQLYCVVVVAVKEIAHESYGVNRFTKTFSISFSLELT